MAERDTQHPHQTQEINFGESPKSGSQSLLDSVRQQITETGNLKLKDYVQLSPTQRKELRKMGTVGQRLYDVGPRLERDQRMASARALTELMASTHFYFEHDNDKRRDYTWHVDIKTIEEILNSPHPEKYKPWQCLDVIGMFGVAAEWGWISLEEVYGARHVDFLAQGLKNSLNEVQAIKPDDQQKQQFVDNVRWFFEMNKDRYKAFVRRWVPAVEAERKKDAEERARKEAEEERQITGFKEFVKQTPYERIQHAHKAGKQGKEDLKRFTQWERQMRPKANQTYDEFAQEMGFQLKSKDIEKLLNTLYAKNTPIEKIIELVLIYRMGRAIFTDEEDYGASAPVIHFLQDRKSVTVPEIEGRLRGYSDKYNRLSRDILWWPPEEWGSEDRNKPRNHQHLRRFFQLNQRKFEAFFARWMQDTEREDERKKWKL